MTFVRDLSPRVTLIVGRVGHDRWRWTVKLDVCQIEATGEKADLKGAMRAADKAADKWLKENPK